ncbi:uncharacterized membrane protein YobD (UPF0266 family) [Pasteurella langaaensis DSM 22999]|uniref:UPF0266 membrane protein C8D76_101270 n=1 Tax=Alitibacter langaaensis DSM 22999 TaxID=1122935 RepID=A0A2U0THB5_9PAST|nr:DUF986 family protein [Pasteurella langaaensis]PVX42934.1 uncharacterized membrane protein YobD (UPF0266 family) [Pasteurella langaaensis DSM 22999]
MINTILFLSIIAFFAYAFFEQFAIDKLKGKTRLKVRLKKRTKLDSLIFVALIGVIIWQSEGHIAPFTVYLLAFLILLSLYMAFFRTPMLIFKNEGFFFENIFVHFDKIQAVNLADNHKLVFDLKNGKRIVAWLNQQIDVDAVVTLLGGYK